MMTSETSPWAICHYLWPGVRMRARQLSVAISLMLGGVLLRLVEPWPLQLVLDHVIGGIELPSYLAGAIHWLARSSGQTPPLMLLTACAVALVIVAVLRAGVDFYRTVLFAIIGNAVVSDLRGRLFGHLQTLSMDFHSRTRSGDLTVRLTSDVNMLKDVSVSAALPMLSSAALLVGMQMVMLWINWKLGLVILIAFPIFAWVTMRSSRKIHTSARKQRKREGLLASAAAESLAAVKSLQAQGSTASVTASFSTANKKSHTEGARTSRLMAGLERSVDVQIAVVTAIILWMGAASVMSGSLTAGELIVYLTYLKRGFKPLQDFAKYTGRFSKAVAAGERISEILKTEPEIINLPSAVAAPRMRGSITFDKICFGYQRVSNNGTTARRPVYNNISFHIEAGTNVAIVGPSGIGKSTLLTLLLRLRDPERGEIRIDDTDIRSWTVESLRQQMSVVLQENSIFATTIRENIGMFCPEATRAHIERAAEAACAHEFIEQLPEGYETILGERGVDLSNGQLQRLAIARAALRDSPILLLDEPTSNLDPANRAQVLAALRRVATNRTTLMITHDLDLARQCDRVLYLGKQHACAYQSHSELIESCEAYAQLWHPSPSINRLAPVSTESAP